MLNWKHKGYFQWLTCGLRWDQLMAAFLVMSQKPTHEEAAIVSSAAGVLEYAATV
uniref:Uncharacterized protein n=1 Tax=Arundo donax TaxID=35708 RepID=A0A0A8YRP2_ARUDO